MMTKVALGLFAALPLWLIHALGMVLGELVFRFSSGFSTKLRANLATSGVATDAAELSRLIRRNARETGKGALELLVAWGRSPAGVARLIRDCDGWQHVEAALAAKRGLLFVTPHLGAYDIAGRYLSSRLPFPLTAMYRPPKLKWLEPLMNAGRARGNGRTAPATAQGVRQLFKTLRNGEAVVILPDQAPGEGGGVWAPFFGKPAYTMTLLGRMAGSTDAAVLFFYGERLPFGRGYKVHIRPLQGAFSGDAQADAALLNRNLELLIRECPAQYLWSYNRYKVPAGVAKPEAGA